MATLDNRYPNIALWVKSHGWIEIGYDDFSQAFVKALDIGGLVWESSKNYETLDEAMQALERGIATWLEENVR